MNSAACAKTVDLEVRLRTTIEQINSKYRDDKAFLAKFKVAQSAWRRFANAQIGMIYPAEKSAIAYGTMYEWCSCNDKSKLISARITELESWLDPNREAGCGSYRAR